MNEKQEGKFYKESIVVWTGLTPKNGVGSNSKYVSTALIDEAKKDLLTNLHVRSDSEALCILINKIKKWFGNQ